MNKISNIYIKILSSKFCIALLCVLPFLFLKKIIFHEIYLTIFIVLFASIVTVKKFSKKDAFAFSLLYCFFFFILETGFLIYGLKTIPMADITMLFYGGKILTALGIKILIWLILGGFIFFIINSITVKLLTFSKTEKFFIPLNKFFSNPFKTGILVILILLFSNLIAFASGVPIKIEPITKLDNKTKTIIATVLKDEKLLLYNPETHEISVFNIQKNTFNNCPILKIPDNYEDYRGSSNTPKFLKLSDGTVFIRRFINEKENNKNTKTIAYIYSPFENKIIFNEELPEEISFHQMAVVQITNEKLMFIGDGEHNNEVRTYLYNLKDKTLTRKSDTNKARRNCSAILLNDNRILVIGGYHNDAQTAELYDIKTDKFTEIPTNFIWQGSYKDDDMFITDDGKVVIRTHALMKNEEDGAGSYHWSSLYGGGYPVKYVTIFNPEDNSFKRVDFNKNRNEVIDEYYSVVVTNDGKIIALGGNYVIKTLLKEGAETDKRRRENPNFAKYNWKRSNHVDKLIFYDMKTGKKQYSYGEKTPYLVEPAVYALNNNEIIVKYQGNFGQKIEHYYNRIKF